MFFIYSVPFALRQVEIGTVREDVSGHLMLPYGFPFCSCGNVRILHPV